MKEEWKDIIGFENLYQISSYGRIRSFTKKSKGKILNPYKTEKGYLKVDLIKNKNRISKKVHILVAEAFIPNYHNLSTINHKDENKENNNIFNLEWMSLKDNQNYGTRNKRISNKNTNSKLSKKVLQYTLDDIFIKEWESVSEIERQTNYSQGNISSCCRGLRKSAYNYKWKYKNE